MFGYLKWRDSRAEQGVETAVAYADGDAGKAALGAAGRAAVYRLAGEFYRRAAQPDSGKRARDLFDKGLAAARQAPKGYEMDALLQDLALAEVELGGPKAEVDAGRKAAWEDVQKDIGGMLSEMKDAEARCETLRVVARRMAAAGEARYATLLANSDNKTARDHAEALGVVGLELWAPDKPESADAMMKLLKPMYAAPGKDRPPLAPAAVALAVVLGQLLPDQPKPPDEDAANALVGQLEGLARQPGKLDQARASLVPIQKTGRADALLRAEVALAAADLDDKNSDNKDVDTAFEQAPRLAGGSASPWLLLRLLHVGLRAKTPADKMQPVADALTDPALKGRAQLVILQARLADPKQAGDPKLIDAVNATPTAGWLARAEWARRNPGATGTVKGWDGPNHMFGLLGLSLGEQGGD